MRLATTLLSKLDPTFDPCEDSDPLLISPYSQPRVVEGALPGGLHYLHISAPPIPGTAGSESADKVREVCIALHIALHCTALHCIALHVHCIALHCTAYCTALHCIALHCTVYCTALHCIVLHCTVYCTALHCIALYCTALIALHCTACIALH